MGNHLFLAESLSPAPRTGLAKARQCVTCHWNQAFAEREGSEDGIAGIDLRLLHISTWAILHSLIFASVKGKGAVGFFFHFAVCNLKHAITSSVHN
jgi:hypothetical protein